VRNNIITGFILIYIKDSGYCVAVRECMVSVWEINILTVFILIFNKVSWYCVAVIECMVSV
jgi:hypothetical protein